MAQLRDVCLSVCLLSVCMSVCLLSVRMEQVGFHWTDFHEISIIFRKSVEKIKVSLTSDKNSGYFT
jgi:hypothetical protein